MAELHAQRMSSLGYEFYTAIVKAFELSMGDAIHLGIKVGISNSLTTNSGR